MGLLPAPLRYLYVNSCHDCPAHDLDRLRCQLTEPALDLSGVGTMDPAPSFCPLRTQPVRLALHVGAR